MTTTRVRMFAGLAAVLLIGLPTAAVAADAKLTARLEGTRNDEQAIGGAEWFSEGEGRHITLKVRLAHVLSTELATVYINGRYAGLIDVTHGAGQLDLDDAREADGTIQAVRPGSRIEVYGEEDTPILVGMFRQR